MRFAAHTLSGSAKGGFDRAMSEYNNFNGYETSEPPKGPVFVSPEASPEQHHGAPDYRNVNVASQTPVNTVSTVNSYGISSIICAMLSCCCFVTPLIGLVTGLIGLKKYRGNILCIIGVVLCVLALVFFVYSCIYTYQNPEEYQQYLEQIYQALENYEQETGSFFRR